MQQRARQERLNSSRKWKGEDHIEVLSKKPPEKCKPCKLAVLSSNSGSKVSTGPDIDNKESLARESNYENSLIIVEDDEISSNKEDDYVENCSCVASESVELCKGDGNGCLEHDVHDDSSSLEVSNSIPKTKRHPEGDLANPKPSKYQKPADDHVDISFKYSTMSFCGIEDHLPDGFYDAGRDRPFLPLRNYEQNLHVDSREIILVDR